MTKPPTTSFYVLLTFGHMKILFLKSIPSPSRSSSPASCSSHPGVASSLPVSPVRAAPPAAWPGLTGACLPTDREEGAVCGCQSWIPQHWGVVIDDWHLVLTLMAPCLTPSSHLEMPAVGAPLTGPDQSPLVESQELVIQVTWRPGATKCPRYWLVSSPRTHQGQCSLGEW